MSRVLIVDDEPGIVMAIRDELVFEGMDVEDASDGLTALEVACKSRPEVILLDLMIPGLNGFEVCRRIRPQLPSTWIIVLTARGQEADRVTGFEAGADDYVVKPFSLRELVARVRVGLRRRSGLNGRAEKIGDIEIDLRARRITRAGKEVSLTRREFDILVTLSRRRGEVVPRDEFCDLIWGQDVYITQRVIDTHIASLRKKLEIDVNHPRHIISVRGVGYRLE